MSDRVKQTNESIIFGAGLAGLAAAYTLSEAGMDCVNLEGNAYVGGLARTIEHNGFRFDLGGHRFKTNKQSIEQLIKQLLKDEWLEVKRSSKIILRGKFIDYPLQPLNAIFGLGIPMASRVLFDYAFERLKPSRKSIRLVSLQDWVVFHFGRSLFNIYFKEYSEKIWGLGCNQICMEWVEQRIHGLSLATAIKNALNKNSDSSLKTLTNRFYYPALGIGQIAEKFEAVIWQRNNDVLTNSKIIRINHKNHRITDVLVQKNNGQKFFGGTNFISSMPLATMVRLFYPKPPMQVLNAAARLRYRDLVIVTLMINRPRVTDQTWIYIPDKNIPFGRIHEPTNWSEAMAPPGKTLLVTEHFCFRDDVTWNSSNKQLVQKSISGLEKLDFINRSEVIDSVVLRIPKAYPLFEVGYQSQHKIICDYLQNFTNLRAIGRGGLFKYYNMDETIASGVEAAEQIILQQQQLNKSKKTEFKVAGLP